MFSAYTTSGSRRWLGPGDEKDLNPTYTKRVFRWNGRRKTFVKVAQRSFHEKLRSGQRHPSQTLAHYDRAVALHPEDDDAYCERGMVKAIKGDAHGAIADLNRALKLNPTNAQAYYYRGIAKKTLGDARGAKADLARAAELGPIFAPNR
jgi:tetratricopeptide (TPR) repeat protein